MKPSFVARQDLEVDTETLIEILQRKEREVNVYKIDMMTSRTSTTYKVPQKD